LGLAATTSKTQANDLRLNFTQNNANESEVPTTFGGAVPFDIKGLPGPSGQPFPSRGSQLTFCLCFGGYPIWDYIQNDEKQKQWNLTDTYSWLVNNHSLKFGVDWRRLTTFINPIAMDEAGYFYSPQTLVANQADDASASNFSAFQSEP